MYILKTKLISLQNVPAYNRNFFDTYPADLCVDGCVAFNLKQLDNSLFGWVASCIVLELPTVCKHNKNQGNRVLNLVHKAQYN